MDLRSSDPIVVQEHLAVKCSNVPAIYRLTENFPFGLAATGLESNGIVDSSFELRDSRL
jgi:hypothetical protein